MRHCLSSHYPAFPPPFTVVLLLRRYIFSAGEEILFGKHVRTEEDGTCVWSIVHHNRSCCGNSKATDHASSPQCSTVSLGRVSAHRRSPGCLFSELRAAAVHRPRDPRADRASSRAQGDGRPNSQCAPPAAASCLAAGCRCCCCCCRCCWHGLWSFLTAVSGLLVVSHRKALRDATFPTTRTAGPYDVLTTRPKGGCRDTPGPASPSLFCVRS